MDREFKGQYFSSEQRRGEAIRELVGEPCSYDSRGDVIIKWRTPEGKQPSEADIEAKVAEFKAEYDALEYARNRATAYPKIGDQLDEIYHNGIDSWKAVIKETKDKYPKR